jgi:putative membrane protein insertion efficiency factor
MSFALRILRRLAEHFVVAMVCGYRVVLAPLLVGHCKFVPTCSEYMIQAVHEWGPLRGVWIGLKRLTRCHPWGPGGIDPVSRRQGDGLNSKVP